MIGELGFFTGIGGMRGDGQKPQQAVGGGGGRSGGFFPNSKRAISSYWRFVSSGASTVASTVRSASSSVASAVAADRENEAGSDPVIWAGFDRLQFEENVVRQVLLLGYKTGFQVWDVEEAHNVREIVCKQDGPVSFLQMQPKPMTSKRSEDKFLDSRPLLVVVGDGTVNGVDVSHDGLGLYSNGSVPSSHELGNVNFIPTVVRFYSLRSHSYVHVLKFRSAVHSVRCSARIVAIAQASQIHCFDAVTLESVYIVVTYPVALGCHGSGSGVIAYGPLAVGSRWLAYAGNPVDVSSTGRVSPQHLTRMTSNGSLVAHYAKESSKHLAAGIATIGDMGYKKLSRYCSELLPDSNNSHRARCNGRCPEAEHAGTVIVRDIVRKCVIAQFRAHRSPISALCFDPSGTLLVTASVQGHNINVFRINPPRSSSAADLASAHVHLYRLQRGLTNAVIQDISFSFDSKWIMISSSRGTSHLFAMSPFGGNVNVHSDEVIHTHGNQGFGLTAQSAIRQPPTSGPSRLSQQTLYESGTPVTLSAVSRIKSGNSWRDAVSGAAAAATGRVNSLPGAVASSFHNCNGHGLHADFNLRSPKYHLLVFSPSGSVVQYALRVPSDVESGSAFHGVNTGPYESADNPDGKLLVETLQKWDVCHMRNRIEREENIDAYYDHINGNINKVSMRYKNGTTDMHHSDKGSIVKEKFNPEEDHHLYISKAELHVHQNGFPLWARSQIYFQVMLLDDVKMENVNLSCGEVEVERVPTRNVEARVKDLVPAVDYPQASKFQKLSVPVHENRSSTSLLHQKPEPLGDGKLSVQSSCSSPDRASEATVRAETDTSSTLVEENGWGDLLTSTELMEGFVNNNESPKESLHHDDGNVSD
ncbi:autophagy-related protein 18g [Nymphaea colorata]|nr:autophagy-related protein 18g [Nymphaea colorata]